jgi:preprotein translocase subunit SecY
MGEPIYYLMLVVGIIFFAFFYTSIVFNPVDTCGQHAEVRRLHPGIRPGKKTSDYIDRVLTRITFGRIALPRGGRVLPEFLITGFHVAGFRSSAPRSIRRCRSGSPTGLGFQFYFGGTSLLIVVGVAMDTLQQIESQLVMRHYDGFMKARRSRAQGLR